MLEDAVYYSRREQHEVAAAKLAKDHRVKQIHLMLADKYAQLARKALASIPVSADSGSEPSRADEQANLPLDFRRFR